MEYFECAAWKEKEELHSLLDLPRPPKQLFYRGEWNPDLFKNCVAVVGSRRITSYGKQVLERMIPELVAQGKTIVSGFMYGVDHYAHRLTIEHGGKTIAVLGWGIAIPMEQTDKDLATAITASHGLIISEWEDQKGTLWTFPQRNRLIVALSTEIFVIEAALKSGSLITAGLAEKMNKPIWAVPGPITSSTSEGTNMLIATGKAKLWTGKATPKKVAKLDHPLLQALANESMTVNELARTMNQTVAEIGAQLTMLTLSGQIIERDGKYSIQ